MNTELEALKARAKALPEDDPQRPVLEQAVATMEEQLAEGEKCGEVCAVPVPIYIPLGGALSFDDADRWRDARETERDVDQETSTFEALQRNIWGADDLSIDQKAVLIEQAARELSARVANVETGERSLADKAMGALRTLAFGEKATKTEGGVTYQASDYADVPDAAKPTDWKLRLAEGSSGSFTVAQVGRAITAMQPSGFRGQKVVLGSGKAKVVSRISAAIGKVGDAAQKETLRERLAAVKEMEGGGELVIFRDKEAPDLWRWMAVFSNKYRDREGEIFPAAAHKAYEQWVDETGNHPQLRLWHVPGTRIGMSDFVAYDEPSGFMLSSGTFDKGMEEVAASLATDDGLAVSHGYEYPESGLKEGVYGAYRSFEVTILPAERAANPWTAITMGQIVEEATQPMDKGKRAFLVTHLGEEATQRVEAQLESLGKELQEKGVSFKDLLEDPAPDAAAGEGASAPAATATATAAPEVKPEAQAGTPAAPDPAAKPEGEAQAPADAEAGKSDEQPVLAALREVIDAALQPVQEKIAAIEGNVKGLKQTDDEKIAAAMGPKGAVTAVRPSQDNGNVVDPEEGAKATGDPVLDDKGKAVNPYIAMAMDGAKVPK